MKKIKIFLTLNVLLGLVFVCNLNAGTKSTTSKTFGFSANGGRNMGGESLFTGDVAFPLPISTIGGVDIALNYNSNVHKLVRTDNNYSQAGWVGLGWGLNLGSIVADNNGTRDLYDDHYYFVSSEGSSEIIYKSGTNVLVFKDYRYWKIVQNIDLPTGNIVGWTITTENGTIMRFGNYDKVAKSFIFDYGNTNATRFSLGWGTQRAAKVINPLSTDFNSSNATLIAYEWDISDIEDISHAHTTISYQQVKNILKVGTTETTLQYTSESYPHNITDRAGRCVEFVLDDLDSDEYTVASDQIIQRQLGTKYLSSIKIKDNNNIIIQKYIFDYSKSSVFANKSKRYLSSITNQDANSKSLPPTRFYYYTTAGSLGTNPGALSQMSFPDGGNIKYVYTTQTISNVNLDKKISETHIFTGEEELEGRTGSDFYVSLMANNTLKVYRWGVTGWYYDDTFPITTAVYKFWVYNDYVLVMESATSIKAVQRKYNGWGDPNDFSNELTGNVSVTALSNKFFVIEHNFTTHSNPTYYSKNLKVFWIYNGTVYSLGSAGNIGTFNVNSDGKLQVSCGNQFIVVKALDSDNYPTSSFNQISVYRWNGDNSWIRDMRTTPVDVVPDIYTGHDYFIVKTSQPAGYKVWKWNGTDWGTPLVKTNSNFFTIFIGDNYFVSQYYSTNSTLAITTWTGDPNSPSSFGWEEISVGPKFSTTTFPSVHVATGKNFVAIGWSSTNGKLGIVEYKNGSWGTGTIIDTKTGLPDVIPMMSNNNLYVEWLDNIKVVKAYDVVRGTWSMIGRLDSLNIAGPGLTFSQPGNSFIADFGLGAANFSAAYKEGADASGDYLFKLNPSDYPLGEKIVTDAMGHTYTTTYLFENGVYDAEINFAKYNKVSVTPPQNQTGSNGKTITYFYNKLDATSTDDFLDIPNYQELDGSPYKVKIFKQADLINPINISTNYWEAFAIDQGNGVFHRRLTKSETTIEGITTTNEIIYNDNNGLPKEITEKVGVTTNNGTNKDKVTEIFYAFETHQPTWMGLAYHMMDQPFETRVYEKNIDGTKVLLGKSLTMYKTSEPFFPTSTRIFDGTNWIITDSVVARDSYGFVTQSQNINTISTTTKYGYTNTVPIATITNATDTETKVIVCDTFLTTTYGQLAHNLNVYNNSGESQLSYSKVSRGFQDVCQKVFVPGSIDGGAGVNVSMGNLDFGIDFFIEFDYLVENGTLEILTYSVGASSYPTLATFSSSDYKKKWYHAKLRWNLGGNGTNSNVWFRSYWNNEQSQSATFYLDNIRIYPVDALCTSQTYNPITLAPISTTDENGVTRYVATDSFGRTTAAAK